MPTPPPTSESPTTTTTTAEVHKCQWENCTADAPDPESLYNHLCNDHIGRKSTNNLCLTCKWKDCGTTCAKRDHITSHLRGKPLSSPHHNPYLDTYSKVHTPLKPHVCDVCAKTFKRPQDLKKHEKIHTEEHHIQHRHSKAITVLDPAYSSRVRGTAPPPTPATYLTVDAARAAVAAGAHNRGSVRSTSTSSPPTADEAHTPGEYSILGISRFWQLELWAHHISLFHRLQPACNSSACRDFCRLSPYLWSSLATHLGVLALRS